MDNSALLLRPSFEPRKTLEEPDFSFCPICGCAIGECQRPFDIYMKRLRCQSDHRWALRGRPSFSALWKA